MEYKGIDVSKYQGDIDYTKVKNSGIQFVIARIGYGRYDNQKDPKFEENYTKAIKANLPIGVYLYSYATNKEQAKQEAEITLKWLNNRKLNLPIYYDIEDKTQTNLGKETLTEMCKTFCNTIKEAGYSAGIYANKYWLTSILNSSELEKNYTIWVAQYNTQNTYAGKYDMWQYTSSGKVDGINGNVDLNILYRNIFENTEEPPATPKIPDLSNYTGNSIVDALKSVNYDSSLTARKALYKELGFAPTYTGSAKQNLELLNKLGAKASNSEFYAKPNYKGKSFVDALKTINVDSSLNNRKKIATKNNIKNYTGTASQNTKLLNLLKKGQLKK